MVKFVLSRNKVTSTNKISSAEEQNLMKKLNKKKIRWIVREVESGTRSLDNSTNSKHIKAMVKHCNQMGGLKGQYRR